MRSIRNEGVAQPSAEFRTDSRSEKLLLDAMQIRDLLPYAKLEVEGYELDFALLEQGIKLNIEVDGDQHLDARGRQRRQDSHPGSRPVSNLDWTVLRVAAWRCHEEIDSVIEEIRKTRDRLIDEVFSPDVLARTSIATVLGITLHYLNVQSITIDRTATPVVLLLFGLLL